MDFKLFKGKMQEFFAATSEDATHLFEVDVDKDVLWNLYLDSFPKGTNEIFRQRRKHDCSCCRNFIKNFGNVIFIKNNTAISIWDFKTNDDEYQPVLDALSTYVKSRPVINVHVTKDAKIGTDHNIEQIGPALTYSSLLEWHHLYLVLPDKFVAKNKYKTIGEIQGSFKATHDVFKASLDKITEESLQVVLDLIHQNSLYRGPEWEYALQEFLEYKNMYSKLQTNAEKELFAWEQSVIVGDVIGRIKNHSIGTLLLDISDNVNLDEAVRRYEKIIAPANYKRPKALFTQKMLDDAVNTIETLGYTSALFRRHAKLDDINVNNVLFSNRDSVKQLIGGNNIFSDMAQSIPINPKQFSRVEEINITDFIKNVLPTATELEVLLSSKYSPNMVSLVAPGNPDSKTMFKWDNNFSWAYAGNITDSDMRQNVKMAGGDVDGVLRFSLQWNDINVDNNDLDAHCIEPNRNHIYFSSKGMRHASSGILDVDIIRPVEGVPAVENISYSDRDSMPEGIYMLFVHCYNQRGGKNGFRAEIEFDGEIHAFEYNQPMKHNESLVVAEVTFSKTNGFSIKDLLPVSTSSRKIWGVQTGQFVPVSVVMYSPNYWNNQDGIGNRHYFFMLKNCINPESPNGFYNEFLKEELLQHKRVFEALGSKMSVNPDDDQLSGIGFSSTMRNDLIIKVTGQSKRILKIKF